MANFPYRRHSRRRRELWRNKTGWVVRARCETSNSVSTWLYQSIFLGGMREGSWSASNETDPVACYSLRVSRATACCSRYADIRMSLSLCLDLDEYSDRGAQPVSRVKPVNITCEPRQWTPVTLFSTVPGLLNSFVLRDSIHVGIVCD